MGQAEIIGLLKRHEKRYFTEHELSSELNCSSSKVPLRSMRKNPPHDFEFKRVRNENHILTFIYRWRR